MGIDARISLLPHARAENIYEVIIKILGNEFTQEYSQGKVKPDLNSPSQRGNSWYLRPVEDGKSKIEPTTIDYFVITTEDCAGSRYRVLIHLDSEDGAFPLSKQLLPPSTAVWCAVGKRLVDFFGGKIIFSDCSDFEDPNNYYQVKKGKYPPKKPTQDSDDRFYQYANALNSESLLTPKEIRDMETKSASWNEREDKLVYFLDKYKVAKELEKELKNKSSAESKKNKLKV